MSRASASTTARIAALLLGFTIVSAPRADDQAGTQPSSPSASPIPEEGQSDRLDGVGARPPESPRLRSVRRPFLLLWKDGRDESEVKETDIAPLTAAQLVIDYLHYWSAANAQSLEAMPDFYASRVLFHGRVMSTRDLMAEKRRFVQRWPYRHYVPRMRTMQTTCHPTTRVCLVRTEFDFTAAKPAQGARSQGRAALELGVALAGDQPRIVFETSRVLQREGSGQIAGPASAKARN